MESINAQHQLFYKQHVCTYKVILEKKTMRLFCLCVTPNISLETLTQLCFAQASGGCNTVNPKVFYHNYRGHLNSFEVN